MNSSSNTKLGCHGRFNPSSPVPTKSLTDYLLLSDLVSPAGSIYNLAASNNLALIQDFSDFFNPTIIDPVGIIDVSSGNVHRFVSPSNVMNLLQTVVFAGNLVPGGGGGADPISVIFDSNTSEGMVVYVKPSSNADLALADNESTTKAIGFATANVLAGNIGTYVVEGQIEQSDWTVVTGTTFLVAGDTYFLDQNTAGQITNTAPIDSGDFVVVVGRAINSTTIDIEVAPPILLSGNTTGGSGGGGSTPISAVFDSNTSKGMAVYVTGVGNAELARSDAEATVGAIGLAAEDALATETKTYLTEGQITQSDWTSVTGSTSLTPGSVYYLSDNTSGLLTTTPPSDPGDFVLVVGRATSSTVLDIEVGHPVLLSGNTSGGSGGGSTPISAIFDSTTSEGMVLYISSSGNVDLARADSDTTTGAVGLANADVIAAATGDYVTEGQISKTDWSSVAGSTNLSAGSIYYLDPSTAGRITSTPTSTSTQYVVVVGRALTDEILDIEIGQPILLTGNNSGGGSGFVYQLETFIISAAQELSNTVQLVGDVPTDSEFVFLNGVQLLEGAGDDYTFAGAPTLLTFAANIIHENDILIIKYSA